MWQGDLPGYWSLFFCADARRLCSHECRFAQDTRDRWAFGVHGGGNFWFNDYNKRVVGEGGELMAQYGIGRARSNFNKVADH
jgi:hypothetical protein